MMTACGWEEVGECGMCGETRLISVSESGESTALGPEEVCRCGSETFRRLTVDEAMARIRHD